MNEDRTPESVEFARLEDRMKSLRPAEVPEFVQARLQFELGRMQGRRETRRAMLAYTSAACLTIWAGTTWLERSKSPVSKGAVVMAYRPVADPKPSAQPQPWTIDEIRSLARYEAAVRGDGRYNGLQGRQTDSQNSNDRNEQEIPSGPWNRQRWMRELLADPATAAG